MKFAVFYFTFYIVSSICNNIVYFRRASVDCCEYNLLRETVKKITAECPLTECLERNPMQKVASTFGAISEIHQ